MTESAENYPELLWHNKSKHLFAGSHGYEWIEATDPRASETRLLRKIGCFGTKAEANLLISGDAPQALKSLAGRQDCAGQYVGRVKLAYIDPPFNTGYRHRNYDDRFDHSIWLTLLRDSLIQIKTLLSEDGSVWVHLDDTEQHRARAVLDEIFGPDQFVSTVIWDRTNTPRMKASSLSVRHDYIHVYRRGRQFAIRPLPSARSGPSRRTHSLWEMDDVGSGRDGSGESRQLFGEPFATPKPERLLARVIQLASDPGDVVLDCFAGSGTTAAVAHKLKRRWVAIEVNEDTVSNFLQERIVKVISGADDGGITEEAGWTGGGGFTRLEIGPSNLK